MLPFKSHMVDEVLVQYEGLGILEDEDAKPKTQQSSTRVFIYTERVPLA